MSDGPAMPASPYRGHVFVCTADFAGGCAPKGGPAIAKALRRELRDRGIRSAFAVTTTGCVGGCKRGANVVVHPDGTWYGGVTPEDAPRLVEEHLIRGRPLRDRLREDRHPPDASPAAAGDLRLGEGGWPRLLRDAAGREVVIHAPPTRVACDDPGGRDMVEALLGPQGVVTEGAALRVGRGAAPEGDTPSVRLSPRVTLYGIQGDIGLLGRALGREAEAAALNEALEARLDRVKARASATEARPRVLFLTEDGWSCGSWEAPGTAIYFAGGRNLATGLGLEGPAPLAAGAAETLSPDILVTAPPMDPGAAPSPALAALRARPGLREIPLGEAPASHRILDTIERLCAAFHHP